MEHFFLCLVFQFNFYGKKFFFFDSASFLTKVNPTPRLVSKESQNPINCVVCAICKLRAFPFPVLAVHKLYLTTKCVQTKFIGVFEANNDTHTHSVNNVRRFIIFPRTNTRVWQLSLRIFRVQLGKSIGTTSIMIYGPICYLGKHNHKHKCESL